MKRQVQLMADVKEFAKKIAEDQALADALAETASTEEFLAKASCPMTTWKARQAVLI